MAELLDVNHPVTSLIFHEYVLYHQVLVMLGVPIFFMLSILLVFLFKKIRLATSNLQRFLLKILSVMVGFANAVVLFLISVNVHTTLYPQQGFSYFVADLRLPPSFLAWIQSGDQELTSAVMLAMEERSHSLILRLGAAFLLLAALVVVLKGIVVQAGTSRSRGLASGSWVAAVSSIFVLNSLLVFYVIKSLQRLIVPLIGTLGTYL